MYLYKDCWKQYSLIDVKFCLTLLFWEKTASENIKTALQFD